MRLKSDEVYSPRGLVQPKLREKMVTMDMSVLARFRAAVWHPRGRARQRWAGLAVGPGTQQDLQQDDKNQFRHHTFSQHPYYLRVRDPPVLPIFL